MRARASTNSSTPPKIARGSKAATGLNVTARPISSAKKTLAPKAAASAAK